jgi:hypothetical protein
MQGERIRRASQRRWITRVMQCARVAIHTPPGKDGILHAMVGRPCFSFTRLAPFGPSWQDFQRPPLNCSWLDGGLPQRIWGLLYAGCYFLTMRTQPMNFLTPQSFSSVYFNSLILSEGTGAAGGTGLSEPYPDGKPECSPPNNRKWKVLLSLLLLQLQNIQKPSSYHVFAICSLPVKKEKSRC